MYNQRNKRSNGHGRNFSNSNRGGRRGGGGNRGRGRGGYKAKYFDPRTLIGRVEETNEEVTYKVINKFSDFLISDKLKATIARRGYSEPTPIQDKTIPEIINGRDVVGIANTGTGKTAAFLLPLINKVLKNDRSRSLIIAPTRELAVQIEKELRLFSENIRISSVICIGGVSIRPQISKLRNRPNFVIGTPGRLLDLNNQGKLNFRDFDSVVLDEVDRMLDMGFINDVRKIISALPNVRQSLFFSATMDEKIKSVMKTFLKDPIMVSVKTRDTSANIDQQIVEIRGRNKTHVLCDILDKQEVEKSLVFVRTKRSANNLSKILYNGGFKNAVMHGNKSQNQRQRSLTQFKVGAVNVLIATDVASRGIDVKDITHVINFDLPESYEDYIHRIGRTGRVDKKGVALSFIG